MVEPNFKVCPNELPNYTYENARTILDNVQGGLVCLLGVRGYFNPKNNQRGMYDDAMFLVSDKILSFNANVDPELVQQGMASLLPGLYDYKIGIHGLDKPKAQQYKALVQAGPVSIQRDFGVKDSGWFGINIHRGGYKDTDSLGCQTIWPLQWDQFLSTVESEMARFSLSQLKYLLIEL